MFHIDNDLLLCTGAELTYSSSSGERARPRNRLHDTVKGDRSLDSRRSESRSTSGGDRRGYGASSAMGGTPSRLSVGTNNSSVGWNTPTWTEGTPSYTESTSSGIDGQLLFLYV